jgi:Uma2 family endonuclease
MKLEFLDGQVWAMSGGTPEHARITTNIATLLSAALRDQPCAVYSADLRVRSKETGLGTYADVTVICGSVELDPEDPKRHTATNPSAIVEVLSPSTEDYDRGAKLEHYKTIESLREIVLVAYDRREIEVVRREEDGSWSRHIARSETVELAAVGVELPLAEVLSRSARPASLRDHQSPRPTHLRGLRVARESRYDRRMKPLFFPLAVVLFALACGGGAPEPTTSASTSTSESAASPTPSSAASPTPSSATLPASGRPTFVVTPDAQLKTKTNADLLLAATLFKQGIDWPTGYKMVKGTLGPETFIARAEPGSAVGDAYYWSVVRADGGCEQFQMMPSNDGKRVDTVTVKAIASTERIMPTSGPAVHACTGRP